MFGIDDVVGAGLSILDKVIPDPEAREKAKIELMQAKTAGKLDEISTRMSAIIMEAKSADPFTSRARPGFLYVVYIYILSAIPFGFLFWLDPDASKAVVEGVKLWLQSIPGEMWTLFGVGYLGYTHFRSKDKETLLGKATGKSLGIFGGKS